MLIALCGKAGAGKDTAAELIVKYRGFKRLAFATPIKDMLAAIGIYEPERSKKELKFEGFDFSYRKAAQLLGTEWGRAVDLDLWVKLAEREILSTKRSTVISDLRFMNEVHSVKSLGGYIVKVQGRAEDLGENSNHASEQGVPDAFVDYTLDNSGSVDALMSQLTTILNDISDREAKKAYNGN